MKMVSSITMPQTVHEGICRLYGDVFKDRFSQPLKVKLGCLTGNVMMFLPFIGAQTSNIPIINDQNAWRRSNPGWDDHLYKACAAIWSPPGRRSAALH
jgi:hypothetical protein